MQKHEPTPMEYAERLDAATRRQIAERDGDRFMADLRRQNPDLVAREKKRLRDLHLAKRDERDAAAADLRAAAAANKAAAADPSPLARQRAADRLAAAEQRHDALVVEVENLFERL